MVLARELPTAARLDVDSDRWTVEARAVRRLAAKLGKCLDDESLIHCDIRELFAVEQRLRQEQTRNELAARTVRYEQRVLPISNREMPDCRAGASVNTLLGVLFSLLIPLLVPAIALVVLATIAK